MSFARRFRLLPALLGAVSVVGLWGAASSVPARADDALIKYNANSADYWEPPARGLVHGRRDSAAARHPSLSGAAAADAA